MTVSCTFHPRVPMHYKNEDELSVTIVLKDVARKVAALLQHFNPS